MLALRLWSLRQGPCQVTGAELGDSREFHDLLREAQTEGKQVSSRMCVILEVGSCHFLGGVALTFGAGGQFLSDGRVLSPGAETQTLVSFSGFCKILSVPSLGKAALGAAQLVGMKLYPRVPEDQILVEMPPLSEL